MSFNGATSVDLGSQSDSCFGNYDLCPNGWTMTFWLRLRDINPVQVILDSVAISVYVKRLNVVTFRIVDGNTRCTGRIKNIGGSFIFDLVISDMLYDMFSLCFIFHTFNFISN